MADESVYAPFSSLSASRGWEENGPPPASLSSDSLLSFNPSRIYHPTGLLARLGLRRPRNVLVKRGAAQIYQRSGNEITISLASLRRRYGDPILPFVHVGRLDLTAKVQSNASPGKSFLVCLLDTRYPRFEQALIAASEASLDGGEVTFCFSPNYSLSRSDPELSDAFMLLTLVKGVEKDERPVQLSVSWKLCLKLSEEVVPYYGVRNRGSFHGLYVVKGVEGVQRVKPDQVLIPRAWLKHYDAIHSEDGGEVN